MSVRKPARRRATIGRNPLDAASSVAMVGASPIAAPAAAPRPRVPRNRRRSAAALVGGLLFGLAVFCLFAIL